MHWIKKFAKSSFQLYSGNTIGNFQPLDFFHFYPLWYDIWLKNFMVVMEKLDLENKNYEEIKELLPTPSNLRALIQKAIPAYIGSNKKNKAVYFKYINWITKTLEQMCQEDTFGLNKNILHSDQEILKIIRQTNWTKSSQQSAKNIGQLITAAGSFVHGLYNDVVTDFGWDTYGPYDNTAYKGKRYTLLIRHFPDLQPLDLWIKKYLSSTKELRIFCLYENTEWKISYVGCHTVLKKGSAINDLKHFAVLADGKFLNEEEITLLKNELISKAESLYKHIRTKNFEQLKYMAMLQECYQLKKLFESAKLSWKPNQEMIKAIKNKKLISQIFPPDKIMTNYEQYLKSFKVRTFAKEVLNIKI